MATNEDKVLYDCIVVGAGIEGSCTARYAASLGKKTLCLEQFPLPHDRGSSHGQTRITRYSYKQEYYANMMPEAFAQWAEIERLAKTKLFINCGMLTVDASPYHHLKDVAANLQKSGITAVENITNDKLREKYMLNFPDKFQGILEKTGGILLASKCLAAVQDQFKKFKGVLRDNEKVLEIIAGDIVQVKTNKGKTYKGKSVILTPGPWATSLLKPLGIDLNLKPKHISVLYWKVNQDGFDASDKYPCWVDYSDYASETYGGSFYSCPSYEYPGLIKVCLHTGIDIDPEARDDIDDSWVLRNASEYMKRHMIGVESKPSLVEHCIYTISPDWNITLDKHPKYNNIVMGVGFSGSGFKLAPVVGKILTQLACGVQPTYNIEPFKVDRFSKTIKSSL